MTVRKAMTFASAKINDVEKLIEDDTLALEQKYDGTRAVCVVTRDVEGLDIQFLARNGAPLKHTAATQWIPDLERAMRDGFPHFGQTVLDGEIMIDSGAYILFDMPYAKREDHEFVLPSMPYLDRRSALAVVAEGLYSPVSLGGMALTADEKRLLFKSVMDQNGEGVMAKSLVSPYVEGKRVKHSLKVKFVKTADVVVMSVRRGRNDEGREIGSIEFGVYRECHDTVYHSPGATETCPNCDGGFVLERLGKCSPIGKPHCEPGDVIEVRYLYRQAGGALVQPTMLTVREDREPKSCGYDQFADYSKAIV
jgi:ATP-dependent DNA ligase